MLTFNENDLSALLLENTILRSVEPGIYSVLSDNESGNEYDTQFGFFYDMVACNPIYNRLVWGYSVKIFPQIAASDFSAAFTRRIRYTLSRRGFFPGSHGLPYRGLAKASLLFYFAHNAEGCYQQFIAE